MPTRDRLHDQRQAGQHPVLSNLALGYRNGSLVYGEVLPELIVRTLSFKFRKFGHDAFVVVEDERAPRGDVKRIVTTPGDFTEVNLGEHSLEDLIDWQDQKAAERIPGEEGAAAQMTLRSEVTQTIQDRMELRKEALCASLVTDPDSYPSGSKDTLTSTNQWSHDDSDPQKIVEAARGAIRRKCGAIANRILIPFDVMSRLKVHPKVRKALQYTNFGMPTDEQIRVYLGVEKLVVATAAVKNRAGTTTTDVWGDSVLLYYQNPRQERGAPTFGWTPRYQGPELPRVALLDPGNGKGEVVQVNDMYAHVLAMPEAGYLLSDVLAG